MTLEANAISSFTFTVPVSNPFYNKLELKKPVVSIEEDGREIFMGYITETEKNFELDMEVTCESEFGYLQDRDCQVENKFYTAPELLALALTVEDDPEEHIGFKGEGKVFLPGNVTVEKPESDTDKETKAHQRLLERTDEQPDREVRRISAPAQRNQNGGRRARLHKISGLSGKTERQDRSGDRAWKEPAGHFVLHQGRGHRELR